MYLDLLRSSLTRYGEDQLIVVRGKHRPLFRWLLNVIGKRGYKLVRSVPFDEQEWSLRLGLAAPGETMIGMQRLTSLQQCVEIALTEGVPGDLVECGVWRGGACILMRAVLAAYGDQKRQVWVADSFAGMPKPDTKNYGADEGMTFHRSTDLAVPETTVRANFKRYGLLDDRVRFLAGWFKDTLQTSPIDRIAVLRLDGDLYESTIQALDALYPRLSVGGFCIIDDYHSYKACGQAVTEYRERNGISGNMVQVDDHCVFWRKQ
jgi:O-methyltransferase